MSEEELRRELEELRRDNTELRTRVRLVDALTSEVERHRAILAQLAEGLVVHDTDGQILSCNPAAERILGLTVAQMTGRSSLDPRWRAIHEDGAPYPGETHPAVVCLRSGEPVLGAIMGVHKPDGSLSWIAINAQPLRDRGTRQVVGVVASFVDITALKQSEARARDSEDKLRGALQAARMGTWDWDIRGGEVRWSDDVEGIIGLAPGSFARTYEAYLALVHPDDRDTFSGVIERAVTGQGAPNQLGAPGITDMFTLEHRVLTPSGELRWMGCTGRVLRDEQGQPLRMAGTVTDISTRKSLEQQLLLAQRMETVGRLAGGVAHDFNNLLTAILGCTDLAAMYPGLPPGVEEALETIREASERGAGLTRQLLSFARRQVLELEVFDLRDLVADTKRLLTRIIGEAIEVHAELSHTPVPIRADRAQVEQVLVNLAVNARDAMAGSGALDIRVTSREVDGSHALALAPGPYAVLELGDSGHGIEPAVLPHIFDPFFTTKPDGTGLGLSTCYGIVKQLGGDIVVTSSPGRGARFCIYLPLAELPGVVGSDAEPDRPISRRAARILLAEDEAVVRLVAVEGLRAHGFEVIAASDGEHALTLAAERARAGEALDLLITDVVMPNRNGYDLAASLREQFPGLPVLFVSGYIDPAADSDNRTFANSAFVPKPYTIARLLEAAAALLSGGS